MGVSLSCFFLLFYFGIRSIWNIFVFSFVDSMGYLQPSVKFRPEMAMFNQLYEGNANTIA